MKTKKSLLVVPAIALVFALVFTTCSNGSTGGGGNQGSTQGQLAFELIDNGTAYRVRKGTVTGGKVVIPAYYNGSKGRAARDAADGLPVTEIGMNGDTEGNGAFGGTDIIEIIIPETIKSIGNYAFRNCPNLISITIPASVEWIGPWVFMENRNLKNIILEDGNPNYIAEDGILYDLNYSQTFYLFGMKVLHSYPSASGSVTIPPDVKFIGVAAFYDTNITSITIHEDVEIIERMAFGGCTRLQSITIPKNVKFIGDAMFRGCASLTGITVAAATRITQAKAEYCTKPIIPPIIT